MIAAAEPPRRCRSCNATLATCVDAREYRSTACCQSCDHDDTRRACDGCAADSLACARKSAFGGRACCDACKHVKVRKVESVEDADFFLTARASPPADSDHSDTRPETNGEK